MKRATFAPAYCALYPQLAEVARVHGYALAVHGSLARDFDLIAVPWALDPSAPKNVIDDLCRQFDLRVIGGADYKRHGRIAYTLSVGFGECAIDLSFMPYDALGAQDSKGAK